MPKNIIIKLLRIKLIMESHKQPEKSDILIIENNDPNNYRHHQKS